MVSWEEIKKMLKNISKSNQLRSRKKLVQVHYEFSSSLQRRVRLGSLVPKTSLLAHPKDHRQRLGIDLAY
jgi:hypothetical protein